MRLSFSIMAGIVALGLACQACLKEELPYLSVSTEEVCFGANGGSQTFNVSAKHPWTATVSGKDFSVTPLAGNGDEIITVSIGKATTEERYGSVTFTCKGIRTPVSLFQEAERIVEIDEDNSAITMPEEGGPCCIKVKYIFDFDVIVEQSAEDWIEVVRTKGFKSGQIELQVKGNTSIEPRKGEIQIIDKSSGEKRESFTISQDGKAFITIDSPAVSVSYAGGNLQIPVKTNVDISKIRFSSDAKWIKSSAVEGNFVFDLELNGYEDRTADVLIEAGSAAAKVTISQGSHPERCIILALLKATGIEKAEQYETPWSATPADPPCRYAPQNTSAWGEGDSISSTSIDSGIVFSIDNNGMLDSLFVSVPAEIPECLYDLSSLRYLRLYKGNENTQITSGIGNLTHLKTLRIENGFVEGDLPEGFSRLTELESLRIYNTNLTSLPDIFDNMPELKDVDISYNHQLTSTLPESLGNKPSMKRLSLQSNKFTGSIPDSWIQNIEVLNLFYNHLDGKYPDLGEDSFKYFGVLRQDDGRFSEDKVSYGLDATEVEFKAFSPGDDARDIVTGERIPFMDIVKSNKATLVINWDTKIDSYFLDEVLEVYENCHDAGFEVIAYAINRGDENNIVNTIKEQGYDCWYNLDFYNTSFSCIPNREFNAYYGLFDGAESITWTLLDQDGNVVTSTLNGIVDYRNRFSDNNYGKLFRLIESATAPSLEFSDSTLDLGLSVLWCTCNLGATSPEESGGYWAWGETEPKGLYTWDIYKWKDGYASDELEPEDDAASVHLGASFKTPSDYEWLELLENTDQTYTTDFNGSGMSGYIFTSRVDGFTDKSIFMPSAGRASDSEGVRFAGSNGYYMTANSVSSIAYQGVSWGSDRIIHGVSYNNMVTSSSKYFGSSIRPVKVN